MDNLNLTFPTEIDDDIDFRSSINQSIGATGIFNQSYNSVLELPTAVNFIALRESLLSEAPFVTSKNKYFWRRCVNSKCFQNILCSTFYFINGCIEENSVLNLKRMNEVKSFSSLTATMASNVAEIIYSMKLKDRDVLFSRLPEVLGFMVVNVLLASCPTHYRLFNSVTFREILLDWCSEILCGIRFSNPHNEREWFFADTTQSQIQTIPLNPFPKNVHKELGTMSKVSIELTPLIQIYLSNLERTEKPIKMTLSQLPNRPLTTLGRYTSNYSKIFPRRSDSLQTNQLVRESFETRIHIINEFRASESNAKKDIMTMRNQFKNELKILSNQYNQSIENQTKRKYKNK